MKAVVAALALLPMVSAGNLKDLTDGFEAAFGNTAVFDDEQTYVHVCHEFDSATSTLKLTPPVGGYTFGAASHCSDPSQCGACDVGTSEVFLIDLRDASCFTGKVVVGFHDGERLAGGSDKYLTVSIRDVNNGNYVFSFDDDTQAGGPGFTVDYGPNYSFIQAISSDANRCNTEVNVEYPPPAECSEATTATQYQSMGCCNC